MEVPLVLQFSIALFTGMVAATFVPPVRRAIPKVVEIVLWVAFVTACVVAVAGVNDRNARELSTSAIWGADQVINTAVGLLLGGVGVWISDHRFPIATWLVIIAGADIFTLMFLRSRRSARPWEPRVRLREWMEVPIAAPEPSARQPLADPFASVNRRAATLGALAGHALLTRSTQLSIWIRDVALPRQTRLVTGAAKTGRTGSRASVESMRDAGAHMGFAVRSWYAAAGRPLINQMSGLSARAAKRALTPAELSPGEVIDIQAFLSTQSTGWYGGLYGPLSAGTSQSPGEKDAAEPPRSDRLAS